MIHMKRVKQQQQQSEPTNDNRSGTGKPLTVTQTYYSIPINKPNYGDAASVLRNSKWVAARCVDTDSGCARFGLRLASEHRSMFDSNGSTLGCNFALRPVVSLSSSLLTGEKTNNAWNLSKQRR